MPSSPLGTLLLPPVNVSADMQNVTVDAGSTVVSVFSFAAIQNGGYANVTMDISGNVDGFSGAGILDYGSGLVLNNTASGYITGDQAGVQLNGVDATVTNQGVITGGFAGISLGSILPLAPTIGMVPMGLGTTINNSGAIYGEYQGISLSAGGPIPLGYGYGFGAVSVNNSGAVGGGSVGISIGMALASVDIQNTGIIAGQQYGISSSNDMFDTAPTGAEEISGPMVTIVNSGQILGQTAIQFSGQLNLTNTADGVISVQSLDDRAIGAPSAITASPFGEGVLDLQNDGFINGSIDLLNTSGDHNIDNAGLIAGDVIFGSGDDVYSGTPGSAVLGAIYGNGGNDTIIGHSGNETAYGGDGEDFLKGRGGDDLLEGGANNDTLVAGSGNDTLDGGMGDDRLVGNQGNNTLIGGAGADTMRAGSGVDTFVWNATTDSGVMADDQDRVLNFDVGTDLLDLSALAAGDLVFNTTGIAGFYGVGDVQITDDGTHSYVSVDADGDGALDMVIQVRDTLGITIDDFVGVAPELLI